MNTNQIIDSLLEEHEAIRAQMKMVVGLVNGCKIGKTNETCRAVQQYLPEVALRKLNLQQAIVYLGEGLKQQYRYEGEVLPSLIGDPLMDAILTERETMMNRLEDINFLLLHIGPEGLARIWDDLKKVIANFSHWLMDHHALEDEMLKYLKTTPLERTPVLVNSF